jgi:hypothetical protein
MSPRVSDWKSHGETKTMSPSLIHTRLFNLPRILQRRSLPSWHLTKILSAPSIFTAMPSISFALGRIMFSRFPSFVTFLLPNFPNTKSFGRKSAASMTYQSEQSWEKVECNGNLAYLTLPLKNSDHHMKYVANYISITAAKTRFLRHFSLFLSSIYGTLWDFFCGFRMRFLSYVFISAATHF